MILVEGKLLTYSQACANLQALTDQLDEARGELEDIEEREWELEGEIETLNKRRNNILEQIRASDLSGCLPTSLYQRGFKLLEITPMSTEKRKGLWEELYVSHRHVILESPAGEVVITWTAAPCLGDLMDAARVYAS